MESNVHVLHVTYIFVKICLLLSIVFEYLIVFKKLLFFHFNPSFSKKKQFVPETMIHLGHFSYFHHLMLSIDFAIKKIYCYCRLLMTRDFLFHCFDSLFLT